MGKLKIGVFGAGRGQTMISEIVHSTEAELVAVCDKYVPLLEKCRTVAEKAGIPVPALYERFDDFIEHDMDAVVLANYANEHAPYAIRLLNSGRHVMTECLTCATMKEAVELIEAVERSGKVYTYAENYCYTPVRWEMRERYRRGDIGEVTYAECEYIHDCSSIWPQITYGERDHWRNANRSTFYCTHSIGPILSITGLRPVRVNGFESYSVDYMQKLGSNTPAAGIEILTLENGAIVKSVHGNLKHTAHSNYQINATRGAMRDLGDGKLHVYQEEEGENCRGKHDVYSPAPVVAGTENAGHGGGDFYTTYYFIRACLGDPVALERAIDVYTAVDMCIPGILAFRSILSGGAPVDIPNLRNVNERDAWRNDTLCCFPEISGDQAREYRPYRAVDIPDEVYDEVRRKWENGEPG